MRSPECTEVKQIFDSSENICYSVSIVCEIVRKIARAYLNGAYNAVEIGPYSHILPSLTPPPPPRCSKNGTLNNTFSLKIYFSLPGSIAGTIINALQGAKPAVNFQENFSKYIQRGIHDYV